MIEQTDAAIGREMNDVNFFKHNFCIKPYVLSREPRRDPSNRRLKEHYILFCNPLYEFVSD